MYAILIKNEGQNDFTLYEEFYLTRESAQSQCRSWESERDNETPKSDYMVVLIKAISRIVTDKNIIWDERN
jgi:hypothetical protein